METIDTKLVNFFNSYLFRNVWNEPSKEYRRNIKPYLLSKPIANSNIKLSYKRYDLPTAEKYQVYFIPESTMSGITFKSYNDWTTAVDFLNQSRVELRFHNNDGVMLPRAKVFVANNPENPGVLIAIKRDLFRTFFGQGADVDDLFVAFYYDSNANDDVVINTYTLDGGTDVNTVYADVQTATSVYVNGVAVDAQSIADISVSGAIVEVVTDNNVLGSFEIDLADGDQRRNFISDIDNESKTIIHTPKALNPDNRIISHNTCDIWIYPRNGATANRNGRFLHRAIETYTFSQVTHNDFAIPDVIINTYADVLNTDEFKLIVQIKNHEKDNSLVIDKNYIGLLYTHDDDTILDFLEGVGPEAFDFWKAETLENSEYVKMIVDTPDFVDITNLPKYIGALGYYNSIALISDRVRTLELEEYGGVVSHRFIIPIPVVFESIRVFPSMFVNGIKLDQSLVSVYRVQSGSVVVDIDESVTLVMDDIVKSELFEDVPHGIIEVRPSSTYHHINVANDDFVLYEVTDAPAAVPGIDQSYNKIYTIIEDLSTVGTYVNSVSGSYIAFNAGSYDRIFIVAHNVGFEFRSYTLDTLLENNDPLVFDLTTEVKSIDFDPPFEWLDHTGKTTATGDVYDPLDPLAEIQYPAWHLMDGDETWGVENRWVTTLRPEGNRARFELAPANQNTYWLIGYRIGGLPNMSDALRASELPINWQVHVDDVLIDSVSNEWWYLNPMAIHTHMLATPVLVSNKIEFSIASIQTNGVFQIQTDMFEPIFSDAAVDINVPYLGAITCLPYLNGKELIPGIDFHLADIQYSGMSGTPHLAGRQLVINNAAYLKESGNTLEVLICHNDVDGEVQDYLETKYIGEANANPRWFDELSMLAIDGKQEENISNSFGSVEVNPGVKAQFDILDLTANAGINPHTQQVWKLGDTYRLAFVTSTTMDATSADIADYNAHVQAAAAAAGLGDITWKAFVSTPTVAARDNTQLSPTDIDSAMFNINGALVVGTNIADLFDGQVTDKIKYFEDGTAVTDVPDLPNTVLFWNFTPVWTGCNIDGSPRAGNEVGQTSVALAICEAERQYQWWRNQSTNVTAEMYILAISEPIEIVSFIRYGAPCGTRTLIPEKSKYFIDRYYPDDDTPTLDALTAYFRGLEDPAEVLVMIPYSHRIVSIRAHIIIRDMLIGALVVPLDPDDEQILLAIADYDYLKQYDIAYDAETAVDLDFVDVQAMYTDQDILSATLLAQINRVIEVLIRDSVTHLRPNHES